MNVLYTNHTPEVSGGERSLLLLLAGLPPEVRARIAAPAGPLLDRARGLGVDLTRITGTAGSLRLHPLHTPQALGELALAAAQVRRAAAAHRAQVVHANSIRAGISLALARPRGAALLTHVRDCLPPGGVSRATMRLLAAGRSRVIANSSYTARSVLALAPEATVEVVHNPVDLASFDPALLSREEARARLAALCGQALQGRVLLGVVAQLSPWKGQDTALEALVLLREQGVDAHLVLVGSAKFIARSTRFDNDAFVRGLHERVAQAGVEGHVSFLGEREDVPEIVRALDMLLLPSEEEPFGRALVEAMALEVPVVATSVGGPPEIVEQGREGLLVAPGLPHEWARAVASLAADPSGARAMGLAGRARALAQFGVERHVEAILGVYRRALMQEPVPPLDKA